MQFCKSWWGNRYIETIEDMDPARMQRGRRYAKNGSVLAIEIKKNKVNAKVQGSSSRPYKISLEFTPFDTEEKNKILKVIKESPSLTATLLSGELPNDLEALLAKQNINLFINDWEEIKPSCSCPDWAVPCKHLAAVMYQIALEIDRNPFTIFDLHDFDIVAEINKTGLTVAKDNIYNIREISQILAAAEPNEVKTKTDYQTIVDQIDFSKIPVLYPDFLQLLSDNPPIGCKENFRKQLERFYKLTGKLADKFLFKEDNSDLLLPVENDFFAIYALKGMLPFYGQKNGENYLLNAQPTKLVDYLQAIPSSALKNYGQNTNFWWLCYHFALILAKQGAFVPEIISAGADDLYKIRYRLVMQSEAVKNIFEQLIKIMPTGLFLTESVSHALDLLNKTSPVKPVKEGRKKAKTPDLDSKQLNQQMEELQKLALKNDDLLYSADSFTLSKTEKSAAVEELVSGFIDFILSSEPNLWLKMAPSGNLQEISLLFFSQQIVCFADFNKKSLPAAISLWLSKLHLATKEINPVIVVEEVKEENFTIALAAELSKEILKKPIPYKKIITDKSYENQRTEFMRTIGQLTAFLPEISTYIDSSGKNKIVKSLKETGEILQKVIPLIRLTGIKVLLPKSLNFILQPKLTLNLTAKNSGGNVSYLSLAEMLSFDYRVSVGDQYLELDEFARLTKNAAGLVKIKDHYIFLDPAEIEKMFAAAKKHSAGVNDLLAAGVSEEYNGTPLQISDEAKAIFKEILEIKTVAIPSTVQANLRPYQERGYGWLYKNSRLGLGSILADDMGLGKTLQVITLIAKLREENAKKKFKALIAVPTTLLTNWQKEVAKFAPELSTAIYHGTQREKTATDCDILLTTYGVIRSDIDKFEKQKFDLLVIDEAQNIKNPTTAQTQAVKKLKAPVKIALSGTPVENRLTEYWSIFDFANKGYLGSLKHFKETVAVPVEKYKDHAVLEHFKKITSPFILRRMKSDKTIISDLPDKIESDLYCTLTKDQAALYQGVVDDSLKQIEQSEGIARSGLVFKLMTALKQICNHPAHYLKKAEINPELSGKSAALLALLENILENNEKVLIFTQYQEMGELLVKLIKETTKQNPLFLHGALSRKKRDEMVDDFQNNPATKIFILSLKAGGTGLNLTRAGHVIHYDLWWNPAVEAQATDRAYRIGQTKNVLVSRLISQGTFEEKINEMINAKKELAGLAINTGENWIGELSNKELKELFKL